MSDYEAVYDDLRNAALAWLAQRYRRNGQFAATALHTALSRHGGQLIIADDGNERRPPVTTPAEKARAEAVFRAIKQVVVNLAKEGYIAATGEHSNGDMWAANYTINTKANNPHLDPATFAVAQANLAYVRKLADAGNQALQQELSAGSFGGMQPQSTLATFGPGPAAAPQSKTRKKTIGERMAEIYTDDRTCLHWTSAEWAKLLVCEESSVRKTKTWQALETERESLRQSSPPAMDRRNRTVKK